MSDESQGLNLVRQDQSVVRHEPSVSELIQQALTLGPEGVAVIRELAAMKIDMEKREAEKAFARDLVSLQAKIPQIDERGKILNKGGKGVRSTYAKWEDLDAVVRPLMADYGFSFSWSEEDLQGSMRKFSCRLLHRAGHSTTITKTMPFDKSDYRTEAQSESSTTSLARRQLMRMALNIVTRNVDNDGQGKEAEAMTAEHVQDIETMLHDTKADRPAFFKWVSQNIGADVTKLDEIADKHYKPIMDALEDKRKRAK